jgi:beta-mannanase
MSKGSRSSARQRKAPRKRARLRIWAVINVLALVLVVGWVYRNAGQTSANASAHTTTVTSVVTQSAAGTGAATAGATKSAAPKPVPNPTKAQILAETGTGSSAKYFGISAQDAPWSATAVHAIAQKAGVAPNMIEYYLNWTQKFDPAPVQDAYAEGALPVITWEPFGGLTGSDSGNLEQSSYSLTTIIDGGHDAYITAFAEAVKAAKVPIVLRFAHEMDGSWYPWSEGYNGNTSGQYVQAWRHVWTLFQQAGATNVIWDWAPNILRGASNDDLSELYPGDAYVDWVGVTAYEDKETTASQLLSPTLDVIRQFTQKPMLISETGAQPGSAKPGFTSDFLSWLPQQSNVVGFIWNETTKAQGAGADWGFDADSDTLAAFQHGIKGLNLVKVPAVAP